MKEHAKKLQIISKFRSEAIFVLKILLNKYICPEEDIGKGSVNPCIIATIIYFIKLILSPLKLYNIFLNL